MDFEKIEEILEREEIQIAALWKRVVAHIIDDLLVGMVIIGTHWESIAQNVENPEVLLSLLSSSWLILYAVRIVYHWLFVRYYGATIGKIVVKIKVIEMGLLDNPNVKQALIRSLFRALSEFLMYLPFLYVLTNFLHISLHDRMANTIVVELKSYNA
ncbi:RDD family protein [Helicobacter sp.]|uniref:RDD family protein n=1 Tax=Helicobacter sp. TaxID=218 RepID=UPI0025BE7617|nr:RDD family protein [Helicobacter sp.]MCI5967909.1 RDD family protein [Helicobacter sp.]MDY2584796.1 RDD family protein [Helicobacter sp.]